MGTNGLLSVPQIDSWEAVATVSVIQALGMKCVGHPLASNDIVELLSTAGIRSEMAYKSAEHPSLNYGKAYRNVDSSDKSYHEALAEASGFANLKQYRPVFVDIPSAEGSDIVVCPFSFRQELNLPVPVWALIIQHLQTYGCDVHLMGDSHQRMDAVGLPESAIICRLPMKEKLARLAAAKLILGVPNGYTWAATAWEKKMVYLYPDSVPQIRWWPFSDQTFRRIEYESHSLSPMLLLANVRKFIREF
jgi:ADP-heptose:LPS heptosyltransferase